MSGAYECFPHKSGDAIIKAYAFDISSNEALKSSIIYGTFMVVSVLLL